MGILFGPRTRAGATVLILSAALGGCVGDLPSPFGPRDTANDGPAPIDSTRLVDRDVEAPDVFQVAEDGLWDGRPSLGGVWVAHPRADDPERVIIRNEENGRFVIGALFRRDRDAPGPDLMVSSDAAEALDLLAGDPTPLNVTALRREEVADPDADVSSPNARPEISATALDTPEAAPAAPAAPAPATASPLERPFVQIGIFSVQQNANNTAQALRNAGLSPTIYDQSSTGRRFWRVVVGPAQTTAERASILETVRDLGFGDAYFVTR